MNEYFKDMLNSPEWELISIMSAAEQNISAGWGNASQPDDKIIEACVYELIVRL